MTTYAYAAIAIAVSLLPLLALALRDPKRLRSRRSARRGAPTNERRTLAYLVLTPGIALGALGQWPAFLIWLGSASAVGWLLVLWLARDRAQPATQA